MSTPDDSLGALLLKSALLVLVGGVGGFINTVAGGASLLCMPVLAWLGLPATMANATNNLATTAQSLFSSASFARKGFRNNRLLAILAVPALLGAILGAWLVTAMSNRLFSRIVGVLMLFTLVIVLRKRSPATPEARRPARLGPLRAAGGAALFGVLGIYGGFFGGGIGLVMLPLLVLIYELDFVTGNSVKTGLSFIMNVTAAVVFAVHGLVHVVYAAPLTVGMLVGAQAGVRMSIKGGDRWIRRLLVVITVIAAAYFLLVK